MLRKITACLRARVNGVGSPVALRIACAPILGVLALCTNHAQAQTATQVGLTSLIQRLGAGNQPTGAGVAIGQVEAQEFPGQAYPNTSDAELTGRNFIAMSGAFSSSPHATFVGRNLYGSNSIAPGISTIYMYENNNWLQSGYLFFGSPSMPLAPPAGVRVFNNSWIGSAGAGNDLNLLRRADYAADTFDVLMVNALNNAGFGANVALMGFMYNGLSVGLLNGTHVSGLVPAGNDGPGRSKPEIVAPGVLTSFATPVVSAAAALMYETAQTGSGLSGNFNARKSETIKAVLLAGANHGASGAHTWSNNPATSGANRGVTATPLDPIWGVDLVNVDDSHRILTGLEQNGSAAVPSAPNATAAGWDLATLNAKSALNYRFRITQAVDKVSIIATWHRTVPAGAASFTLANFDLTLKRIDASGAAVSLVGNAGLGFFGGGNVVSQSTVDNIEHLFITNLVAGEYVIELRRQNDGVAGSRDVALAWLMTSTQQPGDVNGDGVVNVNDLLSVITAWGACTGNCPADLNGDGQVNVTDLLIVITNWS